MDNYDGHLYRDQDTTRRLLPLIEAAAKEGNALLVLACAAELIDRVGEAYFFHDGGRTAHLEVQEFLGNLRSELAPPESDKDRALVAALAPVEVGPSID